MGRRALVLACVALAAPARAGSVDDLAAELARRAGEPRRTAIAVHAAAASAERLAATLAGLVVARLDGAGRVAPDPDAARRAGYERLVDIELAVDGAELVAVGRLLIVGNDLWREAALGRSAPAIAASFVARVPLDAELRAHLGLATPAPPAPAPEPQPRRWSFRALPGTLDLGAPLLAIAAADIDGDGRAELAALTTDELVALRLAPGGASVVARGRLEGPPAALEPRFAFGTLVADPLTRPALLRARSSERASGGDFALRDGVLVRIAESPTYPTCVGAVEAVPGVALFAGNVAPLPERWLGVTCGGGLVAVLDAAGTLRLHRAGERTPWSTVAGVGTAFLVEDLDGDGALELVAAAHRAPGSGDLLAVWRFAADGAAQKLRKPSPLAGGVVGLAAGDLDGDGKLDVVAAARQPGATQVELWLLE